MSVGSVRVCELRVRTNGGGRRLDEGRGSWRGREVDKEEEEDYPMPGLVAVRHRQAAAAVRSAGSVLGRHQPKQSNLCITEELFTSFFT